MGDKAHCGFHKEERARVCLGGRGTALQTERDTEMVIERLVNFTLDAVLPRISTLTAKNNFPRFMALV